MYRVILVEDEIFVLNFMKKMLMGFKDLIVVGAYSSPEEVLLIFDDLQVDVVFLDIEMPRMNGIELAGKLIEKKHDLQIVFTTAYSKYAVDAFGVEAIDYLLKPINSEDILRVIKRLNKSKPILTQTELKEQENEDYEFITSYKIRCFGRFEIRNEVNQIIKWPTKKAEEVFAYFLIRQGDYINKWELLDKFWPDMEEERGLHNLHNTIYRVKMVIRTLPFSPNIEKINEGYVLKADKVLTDIDILKIIDVKENILTDYSILRIKTFCLTYDIPLFGTRDYSWSVSLQENVATVYKRVCKRIINYYWDNNDFEQAEEILRHYVKYHTENEDMMLWWLSLLEDWKGYEEKIAGYVAWFNTKLSEMDLPTL